MKGFSCSLEQVGGQAIHRLLWPEEETPFTYSYRDTYSEAYRGTLDLSPGETFEATAYLVVKRCESPVYRGVECLTLLGAYTISH